MNIGLRMVPTAVELVHRVQEPQLLTPEERAYGGGGVGEGGGSHEDGKGRGLAEGCCVVKGVQDFRTAGAMQESGWYGVGNEAEEACRTGVRWIGYDDGHDMVTATGCVSFGVSGLWDQVIIASVLALAIRDLARVVVGIHCVFGG